MAIPECWRDQVGLHPKEQCLTALCCFLALFVTGFISHMYAHDQAPVLIASMGASAVILYVLPNSPLAQPWPLVMGHLLSCAYRCISVTNHPHAGLCGSNSRGPVGIFDAITEMLASTRRRNSLGTYIRP